MWLTHFSVKTAVFAFSSITKSSLLIKFFTKIQYWIYFSVDSSAGAEIIKGVLASSIKIESTSSTIAKFNSLITIQSTVGDILSLK